MTLSAMSAWTTGDVGPLAEQNAVEPGERRPQQGALARRPPAAGRRNLAHAHEARRAQLAHVVAGIVLVLERAVLALGAVVAGAPQQRQRRLAEEHERAAGAQQLARNPR